jgi:hypothetical protein
MPLKSRFVFIFCSMFRPYRAIIRQPLIDRNHYTAWAYTSIYLHAIGRSERRLIGHSFYLGNFLRKSCATCREKCRRAAQRTEKPDKPAQ